MRLKLNTTESRNTTQRIVKLDNSTTAIPKDEDQ